MYVNQQPNISFPFAFYELSASRYLNRILHRVNVPQYFQTKRQPY